MRLGYDHPETADAYTKLALAYQEAGRYAAAAPWMRILHARAHLETHRPGANSHRGCAELASHRVLAVRAVA